MSVQPGAADRLALVIVLLATLGLGSAYALRTPTWQAPDEPAHYNYVAQLAAEPLTLPRIEPGEYSQALIGELTARRFADGAAVSRLRYEDYQPPLYYYLASVPFRLAGDLTARRLLAVRLLGTFLGVVTVALTWQLARVTVPDDPVLAVGSAALLGLLPMRLATAASANNDALVHPVVALALLLAVLRATGRLSGRRFALLGGLVAAAAVLAKVSACTSIPVLVAAELLRAHPARRDGPAQAALGRMAGMLVLPAMVCAAWFARNMGAYGGLDVLGLRAHDRVVTGQPRTADWIAAHGVGPWVRRFVVFTFESFWGVFGWMGVFLDSRIYAVLAVAAVAALAGAGIYLYRLWARRDRHADGERAAIALILLQILATTALYLAYNLGFVQHQGRYLLAALPAIAVLFCLGLREGTGRILSLTGKTAASVRAERLVLYGFSAALALLAAIALECYIVPGLG